MSRIVTAGWCSGVSVVRVWTRLSSQFYKSNYPIKQYFSFKYI